MSQSKIKVRTKTQSYNIIIGNNLIKKKYFFPLIFFPSSKYEPPIL